MPTIEELVQPFLGQPVKGPATPPLGYNPQYLEPAGYNPLQYASNETTQGLAEMLGAGVGQTNPTGPIGPPPQNQLLFGSGTNGNGGQSLNAGLVADSLQRTLSRYGAGNEAFALEDFNRSRADELKYSGSSANPVNSEAVERFQQIYGSTPPGAAPVFTPSASTGGVEPIHNVLTPPPPPPTVTGSSAAGATAIGNAAGAAPPAVAQPPAASGTNPVTGGRPQGSISVNPITGFPPAQVSNTGQGGLTGLPEMLTLGSTLPIAQSFSGPDAFLADTTNDLGYARGIAENAGYATDATPAWEAMVAARKRNRDRAAADLSEKFNVSGNRFSSSFGNAMTDFYNQSTLDENNALTQGVLQSQEAARQREAQMAQILGQLGFQGGSQLANQDFQAQMSDRESALRAALAAMSGSDQAALQLAGFGNQAGQQLLNNSMAATGQLFGAENAAAGNLFNAANNMGMQMYGTQSQLLPQMMQYDNILRQLGISGGSALSGALNNNLQLGSQLGQQEFGLEGYNLDRVFQEFLRTQPEYSPLLPYLMSMATSQPTMFQPQYAPPTLASYLSAAGGIMGGLGSLGMKV